MDSVVHFEMPSEDNARAAKFYGNAFGWQTNQLGPEMGNYIDTEGNRVGMLQPKGM